VVGDLYDGHYLRELGNSQDVWLRALPRSRLAKSPNLTRTWPTVFPTVACPIGQHPTSILQQLARNSGMLREQIARPGRAPPTAAPS
jgi:hypothetical protein